jgi:hypothetical protein
LKYHSKRTPSGRPGIIGLCVRVDSAQLGAARVVSD